MGENVVSCETSQDDVVVLVNAKKERSRDNHAFGLHTGTTKAVFFPNKAGRDAEVILIGFGAKLPLCVRLAWE